MTTIALRSSSTAGTFPAFPEEESTLAGKLRKIYNAEGLTGEIFLQPLKAYHNFFVKKIEDSSGLKKVAWLITHIVTGIFAYPIFGVLAGLGMLIKLIKLRESVAGIEEHNRSQKVGINLTKVGIKCSGGFVDKSESSAMRSGWHMSPIRDFFGTKRDVDIIFNAVDQEIDVLTRQFKKVYISTAVATSGDAGIIAIRVSIEKRGEAVEEIDRLEDACRKALKGEDARREAFEREDTVILLDS